MIERNINQKQTKRKRKPIKNISSTKGKREKERERERGSTCRSEPPKLDTDKLELVDSFHNTPPHAPTTQPTNIPCQLVFLEIFGGTIATRTFAIALGLAGATAITTGTQRHLAARPLQIGLRPKLSIHSTVVVGSSGGTNE